MTHSYKGGSGKTLISINIASILAEHFDFKVLLIESDLSGPLYYQTFTSNEPDIFFNQFIQDPKSDITKFIYSSNHGFDLIYASPKFKSRDFIHANSFESLTSNMADIRTSLEGTDYDYVILDLAPGIDFLSISEVFLADHILLVLRPDQNSVEGTILMLDQVYSNILRVKEKELHMVFNQIPEHDGFQSIVTDWSYLLRNKFQFIDHIDELYFEPETSFNFVKNKILLPSDDPTRIKLVNVVKDMFSL